MLVGALAPAVVVLAAPGQRASSAAPLGGTSPGGSDQLTTPLLSPRRLPEWVAATVAAERLQASIEATLRSPSLAGAAKLSCVMVTQGGATRAAVNPTLPVVPASNMKLVTATAVFDKLGTAGHFTTTLATTGTVRGGHLEGNLYLIGGGDPLLRTAAYEASLPDAAGVFTDVTRLATQLRALGITEVDGAVVGDEHRYDAQRAVPSWSARYAAEGDVGPLSALEVDDGLLQGASGVATGASPPAAAAQYLTTLLQRAGVKVTGKGVAGVTPAGARTLTSLASPPVAAVVGEILRESDDTGAELLVKELGYRFGGQGSTAAGLKVIRADLTADRVPLTGVVLHDGSGLDTGDRLTCATVASLLARGGASGALAQALPVAGKSGTLHARLVGTAAAGRVLAKTGTLFGVSALSGFVRPGADPQTGTLGQPLVFSMILNGLAQNDAGEATGVTIGNQVALTLAGFPTTPSPSALGPIPATGA